MTSLVVQLSIPQTSESMQTNHSIIKLLSAISINEFGSGTAESTAGYGGTTRKQLKPSSCDSVSLVLVQSESISCHTVRGKGDSTCTSTR